jgi:hypothetical protein
MRKDDAVAGLRAYARTLSPTTYERDLVTSVYAAIRGCLGEASCLQIGSYARFTSITPLHDLDVLYLLGAWDPAQDDPSHALDSLEHQLRNGFRNPTTYRLVISRQTHSITISFMQGDNERFAVDVVPAYGYGRNSFGDDMYMVPEVAKASHTARRQINEDVRANRRVMSWLASDPRGYTAVARKLNQHNDDFRRSAKVVKGWRGACRKVDRDFPLKSFHIEQAVTRQFLSSPDMNIFDAVFEFFVDLPASIAQPQIPDRADSTRMIDEYVADFTSVERQKVIEARDYVLMQLEQVSAIQGPVPIFSGLRERRSRKETFLFDQRIPMLTEGTFQVEGVVQSQPGLLGFVLDALGVIDVGRQISFRAVNPPPNDLLKWKVKNDENSPQPRGEITDHHTLRNPERTAYDGHHFVECYAIRGGVCVAKSRQPVILERPYRQ